MGCCIGKLGRGSEEQEIYDGFHQKPVDKVVITQAPALPIMSPSSFTYASSYSVSSSSLMPESSISSLKDRTFSNEFLINCLKENPQAVTQTNQTRPPSKTHSVPDSRARTKVFDYRAKSTDQPAAMRSSLGPRAPRSLEWQTSPSASQRKRSLTRDQDMLLPSYYGPSRKAELLRSPSPNRRFNNGYRVSEYKQNRVKRLAGSSKQPSVFSDHVTSGFYSRGSPGLKSRAGSPGRSLQVSSSALIGEMECMPLEDLDNPLISLDCFIFL